VNVEKNEHIFFHCSFLNHKWEPCHVTIGLLDTTNTFGIAMVLQMNEMLATYELCTKILTYIKRKGKNIPTMNIVFCFMCNVGVDSTIYKELLGACQNNCKLK
jgi:hypothetical protein